MKTTSGYRTIKSLIINCGTEAPAQFRHEMGTDMAIRKEIICFMVTRLKVPPSQLSKNYGTFLTEKRLETGDNALDLSVVTKTSHKHYNTYTKLCYLPRKKGFIIFHYFALLGAEAAIAGKGNIGLLIAGLYGLRYLPMMARSLSGLNKCKYRIHLSIRKIFCIKISKIRKIFFPHTGSRCKHTGLCYHHNKQ